MVKLKQILLPTDFSDYAAEATKYACAFADQFAAHLHVLHVLPDLATHLPAFGMGLDFSELVERLPAERDRLEVDAIARLAKVLDPEWQKGKQVVLATKEGSAVAEILRYAKSHSIDLIVMSTHGRSGLAHALMGSVAEHVVRMSLCPVLTVKPQGHQFVMP
jgi:nucleotide-binding universal stress UspA family protein